MDTLGKLIYTSDFEYKVYALAAYSAPTGT